MVWVETCCAVGADEEEEPAMPVKPTAKKPAAVPAKKPAVVPAKQESEDDEEEEDDDEEDDDGMWDFGKLTQSKKGKELLNMLN